MTEYTIPAGSGESEYVETRSQFLGHVRCVETEEEAKAFIAAMKKKYYDARPNCSCYILRGGVERYSDDSEPQGTAGLPMLEVFRREGVTNVVCVVTRYFGGVLLGAGGLFRAYSKAAKDALSDAGVAVVRRWVEGEFSCSYAAAERLKAELPPFDAILVGTDYAADVTLRLLVPEAQAEALRARLFEASAGGVELRSTGESFRPVRVR